MTESKRVSTLVIAASVLVLTGSGCSGSSASNTSPSAASNTIPGSPSATNAQAASLLTIVSSPGDPIGQGQTHHFTTQSGGFVAAQLCSENHVIIRYYDTGSADLWTLNFRATVGAHLTPGTYESTVNWPFVSATRPGMSVTGQGHGCDSVGGRFVITDASYAAGGLVERFHASFEHRCAPTVPALTGEVYVVSPPLYDLLWFCS